MAPYYTTFWQLAYFFSEYYALKRSRLAQTALVHSFSCLEQHFLHFNKHNNHQGILLKYRFWLGWSGILRWSQWDWWGITFGGKGLYSIPLHMAGFIHLVSCWWTFSVSVNFCFSQYNVMVSTFCILHLFWHTCARDFSVTNGGKQLLGYRVQFD